MNSRLSKRFRTRVHELIDDLADEDLTALWRIMTDVYYDTHVLKAIQTAKRLPGDSLTRDEALQFLTHS